MSTQYPIPKQTQEVNNQQGPLYNVRDQQGQDLSNGSNQSSDSYFDPYNGSIVTVRGLEPNEESLKRRRPSLFRMGPYLASPFFRRRSSEISTTQVVDLDAQVPEKAEAAAPAAVPSGRKRRASSLSGFLGLRKKSKENNVLEGVEEAEVPTAKHVENETPEYVKAMYEEQERKRAEEIRAAGFFKPLTKTKSKL